MYDSSMDKTQMIHELADAVWGPDWRLNAAWDDTDLWDESIEQVRKWRDHERS